MFSLFIYFYLKMNGITWKRMEIWLDCKLTQLIWDECAINRIQPTSNYKKQIATRLVSFYLQTIQPWRVCFHQNHLSSMTISTCLRQRAYFTLQLLRVAGLCQNASDCDWTFEKECIQNGRCECHDFVINH